MSGKCSCTWMERGFRTQLAAQRANLATGDARFGSRCASFGGTKNGLMGVEAVVFFRPELAEDFFFVRKQGMQLASKMRYMAVQMEALFTDDLWRRNAEHANRMARLLEQEVKKIPRVRIVYPVEANGVFAQIPREASQEDTGALLLLCVERRRIGGALDVLIRYDRRGRAGVCGVCDGSGEKPPELKPHVQRPSDFRGDGASPVSTGGKSAPSFLACLACPNPCPSGPLRCRDSPASRC